MRRNNQIERTKMTNFLQMFKIITNILLTGLFGTGFRIIYVSLQLRVQNQRKKWNFPLNFRTMRKLSELYSGIFQNY